MYFSTLYLVLLSCSHFEAVIYFFIEIFSVRIPFWTCLPNPKSVLVPSQWLKVWYFIVLHCTSKLQYITNKVNIKTSIEFSEKFWQRHWVYALRHYKVYFFQILWKSRCHISVTFPSHLKITIFLLVFLH